MPEVSERVRFKYVAHFWVWVFINAQTIQAVCAVLTLFGLFVYAFDTRRIRNATLAQSEASRRPYFTFEANHDLKSGRLTIGAKNVGEGAALSFAIFFGDGTSIQRLQRGFGIAVGENVLLLEGPYKDVCTKMQLSEGVWLEYTDLAQKSYWSSFVCARSANGELIADHYISDTGPLKKKSRMLIGQPRT